MVGRGCLFQGVFFIFILLLLVLSNFMYFEKGSITSPVLTKPAFLEVKHFWSFQDTHCKRKVQDTPSERGLALAFSHALFQPTFS